MQRLLTMCVLSAALDLVLLVPVSVLAQVTIAPNEGGTKALDGSHVYWITASGEFCSPSGSVKRLPSGGGVVQVVYQDCDFDPWLIALDDTNVYVHDVGGGGAKVGAILRLPKTGGSPMFLADAPSVGSNGARGMFVDGGFVYWGDLDGLKRAAVDGTAVVTLVPDPSGLLLDIHNGLAMDDQYIYYIEEISSSPNQSAVKRVLRTGGGIETLFTETGNPIFAPDLFGVDATHLYWTEKSSNEDARTVKQLPKAGGSPTTIIVRPPGRAVGFQPVLKDNFMFFTETNNNTAPCRLRSSAIFSRRKSDGAITALASGFQYTVNLATDDNFLYFDECGDLSPGIKRLAIPSSLVDADGDGVPAANDCDDNNPAITTGNTCVSSSPVTVQTPGGAVTVTFQEVTSGGNTTITVVPCPSPVQGITLTPTMPICVDITTTAGFTGEAKICIKYDDTGLTVVQETFLRMVRCDASGVCNFLVCTPPIPVDTVNNIVCGCTTTFSLFTLGLPKDTDEDGTPDLLDNCPETANIFQENRDGDDFGDACDKCPDDPNPSCGAVGDQKPGDCNQDGRLDIADGVCALTALFGGGSFPCGNLRSTDPANIRLIDWQPDGHVDIADAVAMFTFLFSGGTPHPLGSTCIPITGCPGPCTP